MIRIVMGIPYSGKSHFIKNHFPNSRKIDLYDYQANCFTTEQIWDSYVKTKDEIINAINNNEDFVVEHTLLKAIRRQYYIEEIRKVTNEPIEIYCLICDKETYLEHSELRGSKSSEYMYKIQTETFEIPTKEEGFENVYIINKNTVRPYEVHEKLEKQTDISKWAQYADKEKNMLGVKIPILRKISKELLKKDYNFYLSCTEKYYEEKLIKTFIVAYRKHNTFEELKKDIEYWLPNITTWDLCDSFCQTLKDAKKFKKELFPLLQKYAKSDKEFEIRFAVVMYLSYFLEDEYAELIFESLDNTKQNDFYAKMGIAWCVATSFAFLPEKTKKWFDNCKLSNWTYNKSIQKTKESFRVADEIKNSLKKR